MRKTISIILAILLVMSSCSNREVGAQQGADSAAAWQDQYDLGIRYLSEGNYEEAIIAFTAAIEIDPKQVDPYLKIAEAYVAVGDNDSAISILEEGYQQTQSSEILEQLEQMQNASVDYSVYFTDDIITQEELAIEGYPFYTLTIEEAQALLPSSDDGNRGIEEFPDYTGQVAVRAYEVFQEGCATIMCEQYADSSTLTTLSFHDYYDDDEFLYVETGICGIVTGDTIESVLRKIGVSADGATLISGLNESIGIDVSQKLKNGYGQFYITETVTTINRLNGEVIRPREVSIHFDQASLLMGFVDNRLIGLRCLNLE